MATSRTRRTRISTAPQLLAVEDLSGGVELRVSPSLLRPEQARVLRNWSLAQPGALTPVPGWDVFTDDSLGDRRIQGGARVYLADATPFTAIADDGDVYVVSDAGDPGSPVLTGLHATNPVFFVYDRTLVAAFDGDGIPQKSTDGTAWTQMGIDAPSVAPTASVVTGGSLEDGHVYEVSYGYQDDELGHAGNESATDTATASGTDLTLRVSVTASADPQVDTIVVYARDITAGETVRRKVGEYPNATDDLDLTANTWGTNDEAPTDHTVPPAGLVSAVLWKNRWWGWIGNRLYFTQIFQPQSWPALFYIEMAFDRGDDISVAIPHGDTLTVFGEASRPFVIIGQTSLDFEVRPSLGSQAGAFGPRAAALIESGILHVTAEGVYLFDGATDRLLSYGLDPGWRDLVQRSSMTDLAQIPCVYHAQRKEVRIAVPRLYPWGTPGEWLLDLNRTRTQETPAWTSTDRPIGGYIHWDGHEHTLGNRGRLLSWRRDTAELDEEAVGTSANGDDLVCDYEGSTHAMGGYSALFNEGYIEFEPADGTFTLEAYVDGNGRGSYSLDIGSGLARVGSAIVGTSVIGSRAREHESWPLPMSCEGRTVAVRARYVGQGAFKWFTYKIELVPDPALESV